MAPRSNELDHANHFIFVFKFEFEDRLRCWHPKTGPFRGLTYIIDSYAVPVAELSNPKESRRLYDFKLGRAGLRYDGASARDDLPMPFFRPGNANHLMHSPSWV